MFLVLLLAARLYARGVRGSWVSAPHYFAFVHASEFPPLFGYSHQPLPLRP